MYGKLVMPKEDFDKYSPMLEFVEGLPYMDVGDVIHSWSVDISSGEFATLRLCNGDCGVWVEVAWYKDGKFVGCDDFEDHLDGWFYFDDLTDTEEDSCELEVVVEV